MTGRAHVGEGLIFYGSPSRGSPYLATPLGEVTKFNVAQVSNCSKVPCSREQQQQNWAPLALNLGPFNNQAIAPTTGLLLPV